MNWETMGQIVAVASGIASVFHFAVLRPLNETLIGLKEAVKEFKHELQEIRAQSQAMQIEMARIAQQAKAAHERLDELMRFVRFDFGQKIEFTRAPEDDETKAP